MNNFKELEKITDTLLGPQGCEWDRAQTLHSMRASLLEEACELIEAIDLGDSHHIREELGDLFFNALFLCKLAEKEGHGSIETVLKELSEKLVRRHPHVFGEAKVSGVEGILQQWEEIKKGEKGKEQRTSFFDGISKGLPALARAEKMAKKLQKKGLSILEYGLEELSEEEALGQELFRIVAESQKKGLDAEQALRGTLAKIETQFKN